MAVLLARHGPSRLAGRAAADGFFLLTSVAPDEVDSCAREALERLRRGESGLAVSPLCGTNIVVTGLLSAAATMLSLTRGRGPGRFPNAFVGAMFAVVAAQPLGRLFQRHVTTRADLARVELVGTRRVVGPLLKVQTRALEAELEPTRPLPASL